MLVIAFLPRSKHFLISWPQSPSAVILEAKKVCSCFHCFLIYLPWSENTFTVSFFRMTNILNKGISSKEGNMIFWNLEKYFYQEYNKNSMIFFCPLKTILCTYVAILVTLSFLECTLCPYIYNTGDPVQSLGQEDSIEKGRATHSSILPWRIQWTWEPGGLQSMGLWRVRHSWATNI